MTTTTDRYAAEREQLSYRYRVASDAETADYLAGYVSYLDAIETEHGLVLPAREENCQV